MPTWLPAHCAPPIHLRACPLRLQVGMVRDLQFVTPVKARIGPPQAACHQTQRLQVGLS